MQVEGKKQHPSQNVSYRMAFLNVIMKYLLLPDSCLQLRVYGACALAPRGKAKPEDGIFHVQLELPKDLAWPAETCRIPATGKQYPRLFEG